MARLLIRPGTVEAVHRTCGTLEVARDMIQRAAVRYIDDAEPHDPEALELLSHVVRLLEASVRRLEGDIYPAAV